VEETAQTFSVVTTGRVSVAAEGLVHHGKKGLGNCHYRERIFGMMDDCEKV
jgi:hypothetical protein